MQAGGTTYLVVTRLEGPSSSRVVSEAQTDRR